MADRAKHDHCSFVLAVVLYHMVLRGLLLRVLYHRAAISIQKRYRYLKQKGKKANAVGPAVMIQRCWRGVRDRLKIMRWDDAAFKIQQNFKAYHYLKRAQRLQKSTARIQRLWVGAIYRRWMMECHGAATFIQKHQRGLLVRAFLDKPGRELVRKFKAQMAEVMSNKTKMSESTYIAKCAALAGRAKVQFHNHRTRNLDMRRMASYTVRSRHTKAADKEKKLRMKGSVQPARTSYFEPMVIALARLEPHGGKFDSKSRVLTQVIQTKKALDRAMPKETFFQPHAAARRARAAIDARRFAKKPKEIKNLAVSSGPVVPVKQNKWAGKMLKF
jgi:hypothetical protein